MARTGSAEASVVPRRTSQRALYDTGQGISGNQVKQETAAGLPPEIRPATVDDAGAITRIYIESWNAGFGELLSRADRAVTPELTERWRRDLAQPIPHRWWVAERRGEIVGFAGIGPSRDPVDPRLGELDTIAVDPPHWRTGVGTALISIALRYLVADGHREAIVWTVEGYEQGIAFYEALGWGRDGGTRDHGRHVSFRRDLAPLRIAMPLRRPHLGWKWRLSDTLA